MSFIKSKYYLPGNFEINVPAGSGANMNESFVAMIDDVTERLGGKKLTITSGYRTPESNAAAGGVQNSAHTLGRAIDFSYTPANFSKTLNACLLAGFQRIGIGASFFHVDNDMSKPHPAVWFYPSTPAAIKELKPKILQVMAAVEKKNLPENWLQAE